MITTELVMAFCLGATVVLLPFIIGLAVLEVQIHKGRK